MNEILPLLLSAGGAAFITAVFVGIKTIREGKSASEESVIKRLNDDAMQAHSDADVQRDRAIRSDQEREAMRLQRDAALDQVALYRRELIRNGLDPDVIVNPTQR